MTKPLPEEAVTDAMRVPLVEQLRRIPKDVRLQWEEMDGLRAWHTVPIGLLAHEAADALAMRAATQPTADRIEQLEADIARQAATIVALADGADKCAGAPHFIVQPFLAIYRQHGDAIQHARGLLKGQGK